MIKETDKVLIKFEQFLDTLKEEKKIDWDLHETLKNYILSNLSDGERLKRTGY